MGSIAQNNQIHSTGQQSATKNQQYQKYIHKKLEDLKVPKHSHDLLNNVKVNLGLIIKMYFVLSYMAEAAILVMKPEQFVKNSIDISQGVVIEI